MQATLLQLTTTIDFLELSEAHQFNPDSLRFYASKLGISTKDNKSKQILQDIERGLPNKYATYYNNMLVRNREVQRLITDLKAYPNLVKMFRDHAHERALDMHRAFLLREQVQEVKQRARAVVREALELKLIAKQAKLAKQQEDKELATKLDLETAEAKKQEIYEEENELSSLGTAIAEEISTARRIMQKNARIATPLHKLTLTDGWVTRIAKNTGAKESTVRVYESRTRDKAELEPRAILQALDDGDSIAKIAKTYRVTRKEVLEAIK